VSDRGWSLRPASTQPPQESRPDAQIFLAWHARGLGKSRLPFLTTHKKGRRRWAIVHIAVAVLTLGAALLAGCAGGAANVQVRGVDVGDAVCGETVEAQPYASVRFSLWNAGPQPGERIKISSVSEVIEEGTTQTIGERLPEKHETLAALPVDSEQRYEVRVHLPFTCPPVAGTETWYAVEISARPANGPKSDDVGVSYCHWSAQPNGRIACVNIL